ALLLERLQIEDRGGARARRAHRAVDLELGEPRLLPAHLGKERLEARQVIAEIEARDLLEPVRVSPRVEQIAREHRVEVPRTEGQHDAAPPARERLAREVVTTLRELAILERRTQQLDRALQPDLFGTTEVDVTQRRVRGVA